MLRSEAAVGGVIRLSTVTGCFGHVCPTSICDLHPNDILAKCLRFLCGLCSRHRQRRWGRWWKSATMQKVRALWGRRRFAMLCWVLLRHRALSEGRDRACVARIGCSERGKRILRGLAMEPTWGSLHNPQHGMPGMRRGCARNPRLMSLRSTSYGWM